MDQFALYCESERHKKHSIPVTSKVFGDTEVGPSILREGTGNGRCMFLQRLYRSCDRDREHVSTIFESEDTKVRLIYDTNLRTTKGKGILFK